jgi:hypothetical protein
VEGDWTKKVVVSIGLKQDGAKANRRSVSHDQVFGVGPKWLQHGSGRYGGLEVAESLFLIVAPFKWNPC